MERVSFQPGEVVFAEGDASDLAYLIVRGGVSIHIGQGEAKRPLAELGAGEVFGEMGLIEDGPRSATAVAEDYTVCAAYTPTELLDLLEKNPTEAIVFVKTLVHRLRETNRKLLRKAP
jgi:CRP-like cAMP-binding protein